MNEKNFEYLRDQVKFTGFGEGLENDLREKMAQEVPEFQLGHQAKIGNDPVLAILHFKRSEKSDMYFFKRYELIFKPEQSQAMMEMNFYINKGHNITLKEAYNLMNGRAVNKDFISKEGELYNAWIQMDFKQTDGNGNFKMNHYHQNYGYDLEQALAKYPIKEVSNEQDKSRLLDSLKRGNRQAVTFLQNGGEQRHFIEANPRFKSINIYDSNMHRLGSKQSQGEKQGQGCAASQETKKQGLKQPEKAEGDEEPVASRKQGRSKGQSIS